LAYLKRKDLSHSKNVFEKLVKVMLFIQIILQGQVCEYYKELINFVGKKIKNPFDY